ncbi:MAG: HEAT repeat domain-containing protein [Planctomycetota bacterium]|jgi:hypothetical protein
MKVTAGNKDPLLLKLAADLRSGEAREQFMALQRIAALGVLAQPLLTLLENSRDLLHRSLHPSLDAALRAVNGSEVVPELPDIEEGAEATSLFEVLGKALHGRAKVRALHIITMLGPVARPVASALAELLTGEDVIERGLAARLLGEIGADSQQVIARLAEALDDSEESVQAEAAVALGALGEVEKAHAVLHSLVKRTEGTGRLKAAFALGKYCGEEAIAVRVLGEALEDADSLSRSVAAGLLSRLKPKTASLVPHLVAALRDEDANTRLLVLDTLSAMGSVARSAVPAITGLLDTEGDESVRQSAESALKEISGECSGQGTNNTNDAPHTSP